MVVICRNIFMLLLLSALAVNVHAATIAVTVDSNPVSLDESFQLFFDVEGVVDGEPDFSPIQENFQILSTSQNSNFSMVNGRISSSKRWTLVLLAKKDGNLTIPAVSFGRDTSPAVQIEIKNEASNLGNTQQRYDDIFIEASVSSLNPYVQSQVIYTLKLYRSIAIARASLTDPELTSGNAVIERINEDKSYETVVNGKPYYVIERNYAVYPQSSGTLSIGPISFMGQVQRSAFGRDPFGVQQRTVIRRSESITLSVRQIPDQFKGQYWLPAKNITVAEEWSSGPLTIKAGEPVTRTVIINAIGLIASQLPELPAIDLPNLRYYPDRPVLSNSKSATGMTSTRQEKSAIILNQPGDYVLPEISIPWWNTDTDRLELAVIPERTIRVVATAAGNMPADVSSSLPDILSSINAVTDDDVDSKIPAISSPDSEGFFSFWKTVSISLVMIWIITLIFWRRRSKDVGLSNFYDQGVQKTDRIVKDILESCKQDDPVKTRQNLLRWARSIWPESPPLNIGDISRRVGADLGLELQKLNNVLYSNGKQNWRGDDFWQIFKTEAFPTRPDTENKVQKGHLEPLYRIR